MLIVLLQRLSCVWRAVSVDNVFLCGGVTDKNLGLNILVECLDKGGKSSPVKAVVSLYFLVLVGIVRLECLIALAMVLSNF